MRSVDRNRYNMPFGGITVVLGGDFRQILPVINCGSRGDVVSTCITNSPLWLNSQIMVLFRNMRLNQGQNAEEVDSLKSFAEWVLQIGNGQVVPPQDELLLYEEDDIVIPRAFCDPEIKNSVENMIQWTYPEFLLN
ncbi:ATP-dependent DNA helicase [Heracleum sosnowskyi]|uniref:ATP-dependent DNA helicase n=1 Tax=Heracleum sosnowskyi TaxID=360622 RepID=A0AAD8IW23_9APIA|nr:ATP-dependent DNA helicase [Heracleum sosnowskyi]